MKLAYESQTPYNNISLAQFFINRILLILTQNLIAVSGAAFGNQRKVFGSGQQTIFVLVEELVAMCLGDVFYAIYIFLVLFLFLCLEWSHPPLPHAPLPQLWVYHNG